jgi:hypothetical protein
VPCGRRAGGRAAGGARRASAVYALPGCRLEPPAAGRRGIARSGAPLLLPSFPVSDPDPEPYPDPTSTSLSTQLATCLNLGCPNFKLCLAAGCPDPEAQRSLESTSVTSAAPTPASLPRGAPRTGIRPRGTVLGLTARERSHQLSPLPKSKLASAAEPNLADCAGPEPRLRLQLPLAPQAGETPAWLRVTRVRFLAPEGDAPPQILGGGSRLQLGQLVL